MSEAGKKSATKSRTKSGGGKGNSDALQRPVEVSPELAEIVGKGPMARTDATKKIWDYIKKHDLQKEGDRRTIQPDEKLAKVIGKNEISMFKMTGEVSKHLGRAE